MFSGFFYIVAWISASFLFIANILSDGYSTFYLSIHQLMGTGCFHFSAIMTNTATNIRVQDFMHIPVFISLGYIPELLGHTVTVSLAFWRNARLYPKAAALFFWFLKIYFFIYFRERERMCEWGKGQRESRLPIPQPMRSWPKTKPRVGCLMTESPRWPTAALF